MEKVIKLDDFEIQKQRFSPTKSTFFNKTYRY